ncbi:hypothetical protein EJ110_NYTH52719 [Nymphaea thermarum]|nr:hypothetical protein EJ110_NYTH52719 [Nymphaea thermarum]
MRLRSIVCLSLLICFLLVTETDSRFICYMPSIVASSIMLYVINQLEPFNAMEYENQLLGVMEISKLEPFNAMEYKNQLLVVMEISKEAECNLVVLV